MFFVKFLLPLFFVFTLQAGYRAEGFYADTYDGEKRLDLIATFLPYNPSVFCDAGLQWKKKWPKGFDSTPADAELLWLEKTFEPSEFPSAKVLYVATGIDFIALKTALERKGFLFLSRWYWEEGYGHALFLRKEIHDATMRTLSYSPPKVFCPAAYTYDLQRFFKSARGKTEEHRMEGIDFIYMINLDERPEKFAAASRELQFYGINPYRFSAVNGWKLSSDVLNSVGARFSGLQEQYMGHVYKVVEGEEFLHSEFLQDNGSAYFIRGMARGPIGIVLSHLSVLQDAYDSGYQTIWVMEDDVGAVSDPREIPKLIQNLDRIYPDWDILFTDTDTTDPRGVKVPCRALPTRPNVFVPPLQEFYQKFQPMGNEFHRIGMRYGSYSMIIRRSGMKKILDYYRKSGVFIPYDMDYWLCPDLKMVCTAKDIVCHRVGALSDNHEPKY